jgi:hypothetical protein
MNKKHNLSQWLIGDSMKKRVVSKLVIMALVICLCFLVMPVQAFDNRTTISFSDMDLIAHNDLLINQLNATTGAWELVATANTGTSYLIFEPGIYSIVVRPGTVSRFSNLGTLATDFLAWFETNWIVLAALLLFVVIFAAWSTGGKRGRRR